MTYEYGMKPVPSWELPRMSNGAEIYRDFGWSNVEPHFHPIGYLRRTKLIFKVSGRPLSASHFQQP